VIKIYTTTMDHTHRDSK
jgi:hypothetical protein